MKSILFHKNFKGLMTVAASAVLLCAVQSPALAAQKGQKSGGSDTAKIEETAQTTGTVRFANGQTMAYVAKAGKLLVRNDAGQPMAAIFYLAYTQKEGNPAKRPVTFVWGGGPGGSSLMEAFMGLGPDRNTVGDSSGSPHKSPSNPYSQFRYSDLVYLDAVGTGFSHALGTYEDSDFWGVDADADVFTRAIMRYLKLNHRWQSPTLISGTSYGTSRAGAVAYLLQAQGVSLDGVILFGLALNFGVYNQGMDDQFTSIFPTQAAIAWYHGKTAYQSLSLPEFLNKVRNFVSKTYVPALFAGNRLGQAQREKVAKQMSDLIGLDPDYIKQAHLRVSAVRFRKELLRDKKIVIGRMDGRTTGSDFDSAGEEPETDAWFISHFFSTYGSAVRHFMGRIGYDPPTPYLLNNPKAAKNWNWQHKPPPTAGISQREIGEPNIFPQNTWTGGDLAAAMRADPRLQVFVANGYYDLATPFAWAEYDLSHLTFDKQVEARIHAHYYETGHMIWADAKALPTLYQDLGKFYRTVLEKPEPGR